VASEIQIFVLEGVLSLEIDGAIVDVGGAEGGFALLPQEHGLPALHCRGPVQLFIALGHPEPERAKGEML
jgi:hypothetical protein